MTATITVIGGLTSAPDLRYSQNGTPIANGTVASTDRYMDRQTNEWKDGKTLYLRWSAFKDVAENIAASTLEKGTQVVVTGKLHTREWTDNEQNKRTSTELEVIDFAVSLRRATAQVTRAQGGGTIRTQQQSPPAQQWSTPGADIESPF